MADYENNLHIYNKRWNSEIKLSPHFKVGEFACKDGSNIIIINPDLIQWLEKVFTMLCAKSINITSGYRTPQYNISQGIKKTVKQASEDNHALGCAIDFYVRNQNGQRYSSEAIKNCLVKLGFKGGIGIINGTCVHIDSGIRQTKPYIFKE